MTNPKATMKHTVRYDFNALLDNADFPPVMIMTSITSHHYKFKTVQQVQHVLDVCNI